MSTTSDKSEHLRTKPIKPIYLIIFSLACVILLQGINTPKPFDDAYITYRYARNISNGLGFVYNPGEKVLGTTTPLYTLLLGVIAWITKPNLIPIASQYISLAADVINVVLIFRLANWFFKDSIIAALSGLVFLLHPLRLNIAAGGMETSLFLTALLSMYDRFYLGERRLLSAFFAACAILIRPDGVLAVFPVLIDWFIQNRRGALKGALIITVILLPWVIWAIWYFGSPIPHSIIAKSITYKNPWGHAAFYLITFLGSGTIGPYRFPSALLSGLFITLPMLLIGLRMMIKNQPHFLAVALYPLIYCGVMTIINPAMYFSWYFVPLIPGILFLFFSAIWFLPIQRTMIKHLVSACLSTLLILVPAVLLQTHPGWPLSRSREKAFWEVCAIIEDEVGNETTILAPDIGVIGWCLEEAIILDPIGLVSPQVLVYSKDLPPDQLMSAMLIANEKPDYIISLDQFIHPTIHQDAFFSKSYQIFYEKEVTIVDQTQPLYILKLQPAIP